MEHLKIGLRTVEKKYLLDLDPNSTIIMTHPKIGKTIGISPYHLFELVFKVVGNRDLEGDLIYPDDPRFIDTSLILS